jgi:hypothetical protein
MKARKSRVGLVLPAITVLLTVPPLMALGAIGWLGWRPGAKAAIAPQGQAKAIEILEPAEGDTVKGSRFAVKFSVTGTLVPEGSVTKDPAEGLVHVHVVLGDGQFDNAEHSSGRLMEVDPGPGGDFTAVAGDSRKVVYRDIPPGTYGLRAELVGNLHNGSVAGDAGTITVR